MKNENLKTVPNKKTLTAIVGAVAASILYFTVPIHEGNVLRGYLDPVGIPTKCMGDTTNVIVGKKYSEVECLESLETQLIAHAEPVLKCTPTLEGRPFQLSAAVSFAYNIGTTAYCKSTTARRFNALDFKGGCKAMNESDSGRPQWVAAKGKQLPGLVTRRAEERKLCERGI